MIRLIFMASVAVFIGALAAESVGLIGKGAAMLLSHLGIAFIAVSFVMREVRKLSNKANG